MVFPVKKIQKGVVSIGPGIGCYRNTGRFGPGIGCYRNIGPGIGCYRNTGRFGPTVRCYRNHRLPKMCPNPIFPVLPLSAYRFHCVKDLKNCHFWGNKGYEKDPKRCLLPQPSSRFHRVVFIGPRLASIGLGVCYRNHRARIWLLPQHWS
jgi:hypothetical protein